jgi:hypothetical protein
MRVFPSSSPEFFRDLAIDGCRDDTILFPPYWCEGVVAQMRGDKAAARPHLPTREQKRPNWWRSNLTTQQRFVCSGWRTRL